MPQEWRFFLTTEEWQPDIHVFGIAAVLFYTVAIAAVALLVAVPLATGTGGSSMRGKPGNNASTVPATTSRIGPGRLSRRAVRLTAAVITSTTNAA